MTTVWKRLNPVVPTQWRARPFAEAEGGAILLAEMRRSELHLFRWVDRDWETVAIDANDFAETHAREAHAGNKLVFWHDPRRGLRFALVDRDTAILGVVNETDIAEVQIHRHAATYLEPLAVWDSRRDAAVLHIPEHAAPSHTYEVGIDLVPIVASDVAFDSVTSWGGALWAMTATGALYRLLAEWELVDEGDSHATASRSLVGTPDALAVLSGDGERLLRWQDGAWTRWIDLGEGRREKAHRTCAAADVDGGVLLFGRTGQGNSVDCSTVFVDPEQTVVVPDGAAKTPSMGRYCTFVASRSGPVLVDHTSGLFSRIQAATWRPSTLGIDRRRSGFDDRFLNFAGDPEGTFWLLDADGGVWRGNRLGRLKPLGEASPIPGGAYSHRTALATDPQGRLVRFGGVSRNDTWVFDAGAWRELRPEFCPPHGLASACSTPHGIFVLTHGEFAPDGRRGAGELWLLADDSWHFVAADAGAGLLVYDEDENRLLRVGADVAVLTADVGEQPRFETRAELPAGVRVTVGDRRGQRTPVLADGSRLLLLDPNTTSVYALHLSTIDGPGLPLPPETTTPPTTRHRLPPPAWTRRAHRLEHGQRLADQPADDVVAILPGPGDGAIRIVRQTRELPASGGRFDPFEHSERHFAAELVSGQMLCLAKPGGGLFSLDEVSFNEVDPTHYLEVDTLEDGQHVFVGGSKRGGWPSYVQDEVNLPLCRISGEPLSFWAQLGPGVIEIGDWGMLYVFVSPAGDVRLLSQSH